MSTLVTVVVPVAKMSGKLDYLTSWIKNIDSNIFETILVHDKYDESTGAELRALVQSLPSQKIVLLEDKYGSPGAARNAGLDEAKSKWIAFWDSDDLPDLAEFLEMIQNAENGNFKIAIGGFETVGFGSDETTYRNVSLPSIGEWGSNIPLNPGIWRWAFQRDIIGNRRFQNFLMGEDQCFLVLLEPLSKNIYIHEKSVYFYQIDQPGQLTRNRSAINEITKSIEYLHKLFRGRNRRPNYFEIVILIRQIITAIKKGNFQTKIYGSRALPRILFPSIFLNFHALTKAIKCIYMLSLTHKKIPLNTEVLSIGGLGNQLFQLAAGFHLSASKNLSLDYSAHKDGIAGSKDITEFILPSRLQVVDAFKFNYVQKRIINFCIRMSALDYTSMKLKRLRIKMISITQSFLEVSYPGKWRVNLGIGFDSNHEFRTSNYYIGYFQTYRYLDSFEVNGEMRKLTLHNPSEAFMKNRAELANLDSLVVHVRLGDYRNESLFGIPSKSYFHDAIAELWNPKVYSRISLFSNEIDAALEYIPEDLREYLWMPSEDLISTAETLEIMRYGRAYVLSNSSFSWWAAALSYVDSPSVVCPDPWFQSKSDPTDLIPKEWVRKSRLDL